MIKLTDILKEIQSKDSYKLSDRIVKVRSDVRKFFEKNKEELFNYIRKDDWDSFYTLAFNKFPKYNQDEVAQALGNEAAGAGWFENDSQVYVGKDETGSKAILNQNSDVNEINAVVSDWVKKNKSKLMKLADADKYNEFYQLVKDKFPGVQEDKLVYAMNVAAVEHGIHYELITEV